MDVFIGKHYKRHEERQTSRHGTCGDKNCSKRQLRDKASNGIMNLITFKLGSFRLGLIFFLSVGYYVFKTITSRTSIHPRNTLV